MCVIVYVHISVVQSDKIDLRPSLVAREGACYSLVSMNHNDCLCGVVLGWKRGMVSAKQFEQGVLEVPAYRDRP